MYRSVAAILAILYLGFSTGLTVNIHYCIDKIASVKIESISGDECGKCGAKAKPGCCKDELQILKVNDAHQLATIDAAFHAPVVLVNTSDIFDGAYLHQNVRANEALIHPPPLLSSPGIIIKNCDFRI